MPPRVNNEFYAMQNAKDNLHAARQNVANQAGASITGQNRGGIENEAGFNAYRREMEANRLNPAPNPTGYATNADGTARYYTQAEIDAMPMGGAKDMARIARGRMSIPDMEQEYNDRQAQNVHVTPELKPNPANQNRPIRTTPYEHLPEHTQNNLKQVFGDKFVDVYNQADPRFRKYISGLTNDFGVRNAAEILMNPDHPRNMMHTFRGKPDKDGNVNDPAWLNDFHQNGVSKKNPTGLQAPQFPDGKIAPPAPQAQPSAPAPAAAPKPALSPENENFLAGLQKKFDDRMAAHDAGAQARGVDTERVKNEGRMMGNIPPAPPAPPELSEAQQQMAQSLKAAQRRLTGADDFEPDPENPLALRPKPQPKPEKLKNDFGFSKFKQTNPKPPSLELGLNGLLPTMPKPPGTPSGSLAAKLASIQPNEAKAYDGYKFGVDFPPDSPLNPRKMGNPAHMSEKAKNAALSGPHGETFKEHFNTSKKPVQPVASPQPAPKIEAPKPVQVKPLNPSAPKRPGILGGLRRRK